MLEDYHQHYGNVLGTVLDQRSHLMLDGIYDESGQLDQPIRSVHLRDIAKAARRFNMRRLLLGCTYHFRRMDWLGAARGSKLSRLEFGLPGYTRIAGAVLDKIARIFAEEGLGYDRWMMYPYDEYLGPEFVKVGKLIRSLNPKVQIFSDKSDDIHEMRAAASYLDVWCPHVAQIMSDTDGERLAFMRQTGKPIWSYTCSGPTGVVPPCALTVGTGGSLSTTTWMARAPGTTGVITAGWLGIPERSAWRRARMAGG